ncbi:cellulose binding domain-containing protein [Actinomadura opuntiae]|uniref:cellulose binding domain-containing protein n=1 Tax=Actinomadura sp. OS1-43 TaxID=604315 RepID=UPI00255B16E4|nr:cellulose binding domain-containing protein [Actinomadura sp. OS1-43]MDL4815130.1 cellulose binding domain-containing protein [Actinomadura sp. OS1-43]
MSPTPRRRRPGRGYFAAAGTVAAAGAVAGALVLMPGTASAEAIRASYAKVGDWGTGYTAQYTVTNTGTETAHGWDLGFDLPAGARLTSLWNGRYSVSGRHVTVRNESWNGDLGGGRSAVVGFAVDETAGTGDPTGCRIGGAACETAPAPSPTPSGRPSGTPTPSPSPTATRTASPSPSPSKTVTPTPTPTKTTPPPQESGDGTTVFAPYVDTGLYPPYDLKAARTEAGVKEFTLAFVVSGGACTPKWGGVEDLDANKVAQQIGAVRDAGGDVRVSFGGASGSELALSCSTSGALAAAYGKVVDQFKLTKVDFDVEGGALTDGAANDRRAKAIASLQHDHPGLRVSFTLPVLPQGLTQDGVDLLKNAAGNGVGIDAVNIMAMDYGDGAAPNPSGKMVDYAIDAATATHAQVKGILGLGDAQAWRRVAVTPMIGVNDVATEVFTVADARKVAAFAKGKGMAWVSMWSATRDKPCAGGAKNYADPTCSSIAQQPFDFARAFGG